MENAIEVRGLCKRYPDFQLQDVSFTVPAGSIVGFIGENGAGKTTRSEERRVGKECRL